MVEHLETVLHKAWEPSTVETYGTGLATFHTFCDLAGISEEDRAPAPRKLLEVFAAMLTGTYAASTITNYLAGVRAWHIIHGLLLNAHRLTMNTIIKAAAILAPPHLKKAQRPPLLAENIILIKSLLTLTSPLDAAIYACLTTTFWCAARLGEFTLKTKDGFDPTIHITRAAVTTRSDCQGNMVHIFPLPRTKTAPCGEDVYWATQTGETDPLSAIENHFRINNTPAHCCLFAYRKQKGKHVSLTRRAFLDRINKALKAAGHPQLQGHSIRIRSVLEYLLRDLPFDALKVKGRWASKAFTVYLRAHAKIMAPYMQDDIVLSRELNKLSLPPIKRGRVH